MSFQNLRYIFGLPAFAALAASTGLYVIARFVTLLLYRGFIGHCCDAIGKADCSDSFQVREALLSGKGISAPFHAGLAVLSKSRLRCLGLRLCHLAH